MAECQVRKRMVRSDTGDQGMRYMCHMKGGVFKTRSVTGGPLEDWQAPSLPVSVASQQLAAPCRSQAGWKLAGGREGMHVACIFLAVSKQILRSRHHERE